MTEQKKSLSRQVAEAVGYTIKEEHPYAEAKGDLNRRAYVYLLFNPVGERILPSSLILDDFYTEDEAWAAVPDFEHDATACITALDATGDNWSNDSHVILGKRRHVLTLAGEYTGDYDDFCTAACKALIKWRKWKDKDEK